jgi:hypothetical protein
MINHKLFIGTGERPVDIGVPTATVLSFRRGGRLFASTDTASHSIRLSETRTAIVWGDLFYFVHPDDSITPMDSAKRIEKALRENSPETLHRSLEGQYLCLITDSRRKKAVIFADRYSRKDYFYAEWNNQFVLSADLDDLFKVVPPRIDQEMLAHMFLVYGWYVPKPRTMYQGVNRLAVGEIKHLDGGRSTSEHVAYKPLQVQPYTDKDLLRYEAYLRESVRLRANPKGTTWVSSSSGWDSSSLIGLLVDEFGSRRVKMVSGSMLYSKETKVINSFEQAKIRKIGKFFGIKPEIAYFDFKNKSAFDFWKKVLPFFKSRHVYAIVTFNYARLSEKMAEAQGGGETVLNGETSDSFHNFGFSQFVTFFHTVKSFTEYGDKMNCYFYGPTFFRKVQDGTYQKDKVYQIFQRMNPAMRLADGFKSRAEMVRGYLFPLFYGAPRIPFSQNHENAGLTPFAEKRLFDTVGRFFPGLESVSPETLYGWIIYLYHSMHSQGSTVNIQKHAMEMNGHHWRSPYNDLRLVRLLSEAPESWGRGLDFNNTKYPLKWVLKNRLKFPYELLQEGPHSYLYDVLEGFSLTEEIVYRSGVTGYFRETLSSKPYRRLLDDRYFNVKNLDSIVNAYLRGREVKGQDFNNLVTLITLSITGWYGAA